jgi:branched-chain amino acid transport system permease protein
MTVATDTSLRDLPSARPKGMFATYGVWVAAAIVLAVLPMIFYSGSAVSTMCLMGITIIFALSYNMLLGQTGLLSFGHAVFYGMGGFLTVYALNQAESVGAPLPLWLFPLAGGTAGLIFGVIFGWISTRRAGVTFAMITLGIGELVASVALILRHVFGGEEGITTDRTALLHLFGITFGSQVQVYYLIAGWCFVSAALMYAFTRTPLGRICSAVRDNPERARFIGYNTQTVRFISFSIASLFAGISGGLAACNFEIMNSSQLGGAQSATVILMTYIGGVGIFSGPVIGAILVTWLQLTLSDVTDVWQLYFGLLFVGMVMYAPEGIAGMLARQLPLLRAGRLHRVVPYYALALVPGLAALIGLATLIELVNRIAADSSYGPAMVLFGVPVRADSPLPWLAGLVLLAGGGRLFRHAAHIALEAYNASLAAVPARAGGPGA